MNTSKRTPINKINRTKKVCGAGINDADYSITHCPFYRKWSAMIHRCYNPEMHAKFPTYIDCTVSKEWLTFSNFRAWMEKQDWEGMQLDKDIVSPCNKVYSEENCIFVTGALNLLLIDCGASRGKYPKGVSVHKGSGKFQANCSTHNKQNHLGYYPTPEAASKAYNKFKALHIIDVAQSYLENTRLYDGLISHAARLSLK